MRDFMPISPSTRLLPQFMPAGQAVRAIVAAARARLLRHGSNRLPGRLLRLLRLLPMALLLAPIGQLQAHPAPGKHARLAGQPATKPAAARLGKTVRTLPAPVLQALQQARIPRSAMATLVQSADGRHTLLSHLADVPLQPASTIKLLTTFAALDQFGPAKRWPTRIYASAPVVNGVLRGDLIIEGGGDPKLVFESFWLLLRQLRQQGLQRIEGNLLLARSLFQIEPFDAAQFDGDPAKAYNVGPDALLLNFKSIRLRLAPEPASGRIVVQSEPALSGMQITAPATGSGACPEEWQEQLVPQWQGTTLSFGGSYAPACGVRYWTMHPYGLSANQYAYGLFAALWREVGGSISGQAFDGVVPPGALLLAQTESPPLAEIIRDINKFSNNVMARHLLLLLGAQASDAGSSTTPTGAAAAAAAPAAAAPAAALTPARGMQAMANWLAAQNLAMPELVLENGSGLSRNERISAASLNRLLQHAWASPFMPEFIASLPVVAHDGTMRRRLQQSPVAGQAHIKTGSLAGVRSLAGYVRGKSGRIWVVSVILNHELADSGRIAHDLLLEWIFDNG